MSVISVRNLGICYTLRRSRERSLRRRLLQLLTGERMRGQFWALRHVSLDLHEGETLGVIGPNGAGKSTLCMAIARILPSDEGEVRANGKVAPILALGAGFNNEMTGLENIFLSGALMGLSRDKMRTLVPSILSFAELGEFVDVPVRVYSTGMRARLAFSIATSIDPDVLVLDEILSVGDAAFRRKSETRMMEFMSRARAIVLASHSMETIRRLCDRTLWLEKGRVEACGPTQEIIEEYRKAQQADRTDRQRGLGIHADEAAG